MTVADQQPWPPSRPDSFHDPGQIVPVIPAAAPLYRHPGRSARFTVIPAGAPPFTVIPAGAPPFTIIPAGAQRRAGIHTEPGQIPPRGAHPIPDGSRISLRLSGMTAREASQSQSPLYRHPGRSAAESRDPRGPSPGSSSGPGTAARDCRPTGGLPQADARGSAPAYPHPRTTTRNPEHTVGRHSHADTRGTTQPRQLIRPRNGGKGLPPYGGPKPPPPGVSSTTQSPACTVRRSQESRRSNEPSARSMEVRPH
jgi:hypothetical protein